MKLSHVMFAVAALSAGAAQAGTERLSGASASSINVVKALRTLCTGNAGTFNLYKSASSLSSLGNFATGTCTGAAFTGTVDQVRINVAGGSYGAVLARTGNTGAGTGPVTMIDPATATCTTLGAGTGPLSFMLANEMKNCGTVGHPTETSDGGYLDVEGSVFRAYGLAIPPEVDDTTDFIPSAFVQSFGVGASAKLYQALQEYQTAKGQLPSTCATGVLNAGVTTYTASNSTTPECQPNISRAAYAAMMASGNNQAKKAGANFFIGGTATVANDLPADKAITTAVPLGTDFDLCRRVDTSGTHASTQLYFLNKPTGTGDLGGALSTAGGAAPGTVLIGPNYRVISNSGTSDVKNCMNAANVFAAGVVSMENNPIGGSDTFRFVKLNNQSGSEGVAGSAQTAEAIAGRYDFVYQSVKYCPGGTCASVLDAIDTALAPGASTPGLFLSSESIYTRGGKATQPVSTKP